MSPWILFILINKNNSHRMKVSHKCSIQSWNDPSSMRVRLVPSDPDTVATHPTRRPTDHCFLAGSGWNPVTGPHRELYTALPFNDVLGHPKQHWNMRYTLRIVIKYVWIDDWYRTQHSSSYIVCSHSDSTPRMTPSMRPTRRTIMHDIIANIF